MSKKVEKGFAAMPREQVRAIAKLGGIAAHEKKRAHQWNSKEASLAGKKGGAVTQERRRTAKLNK